MSSGKTIHNKGEMSADYDEDMDETNIDVPLGQDSQIIQDAEPDIIVTVGKIMSFHFISFMLLKNPHSFFDSFVQNICPPAPKLRPIQNVVPTFLVSKDKIITDFNTTKVNFESLVKINIQDFIKL